MRNGRLLQLSTGRISSFSFNIDFYIVLTSQSTPADFCNAFQLGEEKAFDLIFQKYYSSLCFFAAGYLKDEEEAKDLVQGCFTKLWEQRTQISKFEYVKSFLYTTVRNRCIDALRRKKVREGRLAAIPIQIDEWKEPELDELTKAETMRIIYEAIQSLPKKTQQIVKMHFIEGKKLQEIASQLNQSYDSVRQQRRRALTFLKGKLLPFLILFFFCFNN